MRLDFCVKLKYRSVFVGIEYFCATYSVTSITMPHALSFITLGLFFIQFYFILMSNHFIWCTPGFYSYALMSVQLSDSSKCVPISPSKCVCFSYCS